jgi:MFS family permease
MPTRLVAKVLRVKSRHHLIAIYAATLLLIFHSFLVAYINSSYIDQFVDDKAVGMIFTVGSALTVIIFLFVSHVLKKVGNYYATLSFLALNFLAVLGMAFADSLRTAVPLLIIHLTLIPLIIFNLDVFLEEHIGNKEGTTGTKRGLVLALSSLVGACTPLFTGFLLFEQDGFSHAYLASAVLVIPIFFLVLVAFKNFEDPKYAEIKFFQALRSFWIKKNIRNALLSHFLLQIFFFFMVVYAPLYLATKIGLDWWSIGLILFGGQLAYVFFEYPIGLISDLYIGEKEMMAVGFLMLAASSAIIAFVSVPVIWLWILVMFTTRIGAALVEVTTESYFFKQTKSSDAQIISFFRVTRPLAYVFGALFGSLVLLYLPFNLIFVALGLAMLPGAILATLLKDTK